VYYGTSLLPLPPSAFRHSSRLVVRLCGLVVRVPGYRSRCPGSIPDATKFSEK
jgi:hypothetical protein